MTQANPNWQYEICAKCDHFIEDDDDDLGHAVVIHLDDGEQPTPDHDATNSGLKMPLASWKITRPDLFWTHRDGKIGPNSRYHIRRKRTRLDPVG